MDEAKIGGQIPEAKNQSKPIFQDMVPGVISVDELVFEIGKHVVRALNNEKFAEKVVAREKEYREKTTETIDQLTRQVDELAFLKKKNEELVRSNKAFEARNFEMAEALDVSRKEVEKLTSKLSPMDMTIGKLSGERDFFQVENERLQKEMGKLVEVNDRLTKKLEATRRKTK